MAKAKVKRQDTTIDMTAMCDVSFLLLTFFVLTATARQEETLMVDTPASTVQDKLPDTNLAVITVGNNGKIFYHIADREVRRRTLENISAKYEVPFSDEDYHEFSRQEDFGVPVKNLRQLLSLNADERNESIQSGIPVDSTENTSNELYQWVQQTRLATVAIEREREADQGVKYTNPGPLKIAIKADAEEKYPSINLIIETLRNQKQNKFSFVTDLRASN